jgi:hypothetical protein
MSADEFEVQGPHDHEVEHAGLSGDPFSARIAVMTAIFATFGALFGYMVGATQNDALLFKNDSAIRMTEASDQWNFYQSKSSKQNLSELAAAIVADDKKDFYRKEIDRYKGEKAEVMLAAKKLEAEAKAWDEKSEAQMHVHHRWAQATTLIQVSIALAAIALLTRKKWLEWGMVGVGGAGIVVGALAGLHV